MWIAVEAVGERAGFVAAAGPAAQLALGLLGGVYADRWDKRRAMLAADLLRSVAVGTLAVAGVFDRISLVHLAGVAFVLGALDGLFQPALRASLPLLAPDLESLKRANAWFEITPRLSAVIGPPLTGVLLAVLPIEQFFTLDAATFGASAVAVAALGRAYAWKAPARAPATRRRLRQEIRGALSLVAANRPIAWSIGLTALWNIGSSIAMTVGLPLLAREVLGGGPALYGLLVGAYGAGNVLSNLLLVWRPARRPVAVMFSGGIVWGAGFVGVALAPTVPVALGCCALAAIGGPLTDVTRAVLIQTGFPLDQIGKVYSLRVTVARASAGLGLLAAAPLFAWGGVRPSIAGAASAVAIPFAVACAWFGRREADSGRGEP